jgi:hypothetical protein
VLGFRGGLEQTEADVLAEGREVSDQEHVSGQRVHQVPERSRRPAGQALDEQTHRHIVGETYVGDLLLMTTTAGQDAVIAVDANDLAGWIVDAAIPSAAPEPARESRSGADSSS